MKSILTMAWTAEDPSAFDLAAKLARTFDAKLVGLEPPSYGVMSMAWADAGMGAPIGGGLAEDAEERQRVAAMIKPNQTVAVFFSGVGPYPITLARHTKVKKVYALEWNPAAKPFLEENMRLNKVEGKIIPLWGDVEKIRIPQKVDHVVMPAPETALGHLWRALEWCRPKGMVHLYLFLDSTNPSRQLKSILGEHIPPNYTWKQVFARKVSDFSPRKQQWCVGVQLISSKKASIKKSKKKGKA